MARPEVTGRQIAGDKPLVVGTTKACFLLDCGKDKLYELIKRGELESYMQDDRRKITMRSIDALIDKRLATGGKFQRSSKIPPARNKSAG